MAEALDLRRIRRGCKDKGLRRMLLEILSAGHPYRMTKSGIIVHGPDGICGTHLANSDHRAARNFSADLRRCGITLEKRK